jgi:hypothetical protein
LADKHVAGSGTQAVEHGSQPVATLGPPPFRPQHLHRLLGVQLAAADRDELEKLCLLTGTKPHGPPRHGELEATEHSQCNRERAGPEGRCGRLPGIDSEPQQLLGYGALPDEGKLRLAQTGRLFEGSCRQRTRGAVLATAEGGERS